VPESPTTATLKVLTGVKSSADFLAVPLAIAASRCHVTLRHITKYRRRYRAFCFSSNIGNRMAQKSRKIFTLLTIHSSNIAVQTSKYQVNYQQKIGKKYHKQDTKRMVQKMIITRE